VLAEFGVGVQFGKGFMSQVRSRLSEQRQRTKKYLRIHTTAATTTTTSSMNTNAIGCYSTNVSLAEHVQYVSISGKVRELPTPWT
jgi:hypothetical protein